MKKKLIKILLDARRRVSVATKPSNEVYPDGNAESKWNEGNATVGWAPTRATSTSDASEKVHGDYSLKTVCTSLTSGCRNQLLLAVTSGKSYQFTFKSKRLRVSTTGQNMRVWLDYNNATGNRVIVDVGSDTDWASKDHTLAAGAYTGDIQIRIEPTASTVDAIGDTIWADEFSILETDT